MIRKLIIVLPILLVLSVSCAAGEIRNNVLIERFISKNSKTDKLLENLVTQFEHVSKKDVENIDILYKRHSYISEDERIYQVNENRIDVYIGMTILVDDSNQIIISIPSHEKQQNDNLNTIFSNILIESIYNDSRSMATMFMQCFKNHCKDSDIKITEKTDYSDMIKDIMVPGMVIEFHVVNESDNYLDPNNNEIHRFIANCLVDSLQNIVAGEGGHGPP